MSSEKQLREIAATAIREHLQDEPLNAIFEDVCCEQSLDPEHPDAERIYDLIRHYPVPDLPVPDQDGRLWPENDFNYSHVQSSKFTGTGNVIIARGDWAIALTREEALELASLLTAAATEEA